MLPRSIASILVFPFDHTVAAYVFFPAFASLSSFPVFYIQWRVRESSSYATCDQSIWPSFFLLHVGYSSAPWLYVTLLHFPHDRSSWSPSFSSTTLQNFPGISYLPPGASKFQHHTKSFAPNVAIYWFFLEFYVKYFGENSPPPSAWMLLLPRHSWI